jgi:hypothetical protein
VTRNAIGVGLATGVYGISFGALAVTSGFSFAQTQVLSLGLFSGASQFAVVGIMGAGGGAVAAIATSSLLGFRNGLYALSIANVLKLKGFKKVIASQLTIDESTAMSVANNDDEEMSRNFCFCFLEHCNCNWCLWCFFCCRSKITWIRCCRWSSILSSTLATTSQQTNSSCRNSCRIIGVRFDSLCSTWNTSSCKCVNCNWYGLKECE